MRMRIRPWPVLSTMTLHPPPNTILTPSTVPIAVATQRLAQKWNTLWILPPFS